MTDDAAEFLSALRAVVERMGASVVAPRSARDSDEPVLWRGATVGFVRVNELHGALNRLIMSVERELGCRLSGMDRAQKQAAVRLLDERGAFLLRGAVEDVARRMGVSKVTLYNYLNALESD